MVGRWPDFETMADMAAFCGGVPLDASHVSRRLHHKVYIHWLSLLKGRTLPSVKDIDPAALAFAARQGLWIELGSPEPMLRDIGAALAEEGGVGTGPMPLALAPSRSFIARLCGGYVEVLAKRAPVGTEGELATMRDNPARYRAILLPFASNGHDIDVIYGAINWKELFGLR